MLLVGNWQVPYALLLAVLVSALILAFGYIRYRSFRGMRFGARIKHTVGESELARFRSMKRTVRVHTLEDAGDERAVGLEIATRAGFDYRVWAVPLSKSDAKRLGELLLLAAQGRGA